MKRAFLCKSLNLIEKYNPDIDEIKLDEIRYGLEAFYLTITKMVIIVILSLSLGVFYKMVLLLLFYNFLRIPAGGIHATKSWICLLFSIIILIGIPSISCQLVFSRKIKYFFGLVGILLIYKYAPADTHKAPILSIRRRKKYRIYATVNSIILFFVAMKLDNWVGNFMILSIIIEVILILPMTYRIFNMPYDNYKNYIYSN